MSKNQLTPAGVKAMVDESSMESMEVSTTTTTTRVKRVISDTHLMRAYTAVKDAVEALNQDLDPEMNQAGMPETIECPSLVVTGTQSAGKTSFIETMVGFPVGYTARGTGTRCPVRYILRPSKTAKYKVDGGDVEGRNGLLEAVNRKMRILEKANKFEEAPIVVEIHEPDVMDMDVIDLPGLKTAEDPDQEQIVKIVSKYLRRSDVTPVVLTRAQPSPDTQHDMQVLKDNGLSLEQSILIVNGVNDTLRHIHNMSEVNEHFREYMRWGKECKAVRFVMFHPTLQSHLDKDALKPDEAEDFLRNLPIAEVADLNAYLDSPSVKGGGSEDLDPAVRSRFGVTNSHLALLDELQTWTKKNGFRTAQVLTSRMPPLRASQRRIQDQIIKQRGQIENMDANIFLYADKFQASMNSIRNDKTVLLEVPAHDSSFTGLVDPLSAVPRKEFALTYEEEMQLLNSQLKNMGHVDLMMGAEQRPEYRVWKSHLELKKELADTHTGESLHEHLTCASSIQRLVKIVGFQIMKREMCEYSKEDVSSKHIATLMGATDATTVIKQLVGDQIRQVFQDVFPRLLEHIRFLCERPMDLAHVALAKNFPDIAQLHELHATLNETFSGWLHSSLDACNAHLRAMMQEKMTSFAVDADTRLIQLMCLTPMDDSLDLLPRLMKDESDPDVEGKKDPEGEAHVSGHGLHKDTPAYRALQDVRRAVRVSGKPERVRIIDFVEGGLTGIPATEAKELHTVVNKIGQKFFMQMKGLLVLELESKIQMYLLAPLAQTKGSDDELNHRIRNSVATFMKSDYKQSLAHTLGTNDLEHLMVKKKDRQKKIEEALRTLNKNLHGAQPSSRL